MFGPAYGFRAGCAQHPLADLDDQAGIFRHRDEGGRRDHAAFRMAPAHQRLAAGYAIALQLDQRLVMDLEAATWPDHIRVAVNVSPIQLKCQTLAIRIAGALATSGLRPDRLEIEITEAVLIRDDEVALAILHQLRDIGVRIALDDFGTGYSSLSYLQRFPFDKIKIDRCFVKNIDAVDGSTSIVQAVVNIAAALNMTTVAEGVETEPQRALLRELGCTSMQGYLFSPPKPAAEVKRFFSTRPDRAAVA